MVSSHTDTRRLSALLTLLVSEREITVGVHADEGSQAHGSGGANPGATAASKNSGATIGEIAAWHEIGTKNVPPRSWLRGWVDEREDAIKGELGRAALFSLTTGAPLRVGAGRFAVWAEADIRQRVRKGLSPALDPRTVKRKGSSTPLIDTGVFLAAIKARVD